MNVTEAMAAFLEERPHARKILDLHFNGLAPSQIDAELGLLMGDSKRAILEYWKFDDAWYRHVKHKHRTRV